MSYTHFSRRNFLFTTLACSSIFLGVNYSSAQTPPTRGQPALIPNALQEAENLNASSKAVNSYGALSDNLNKKTNISATEFTEFDREAGIAKNAITSIKTNLQSIIQKAKAAGVWENLDDSFAIELQKVQAPAEQKAHYLSWVKSNGGAKSVLEGALAQLDAIPGQISDDVESIKTKKLGFNLDLVTPAYGRIALWRCAVVAAIGIGTLCSGCVPCGAAAVGVMAVNC